MAPVDVGARNAAPASIFQAVSHPERPWRSSQSRWFRIGDADLELLSDCDALLHELDAVYGDLEVSPAPAPRGTSSVRCTARRLPEGPFLSLSFDGPSLRDPLETARHRFLVRRRYVEVPGPVTGWRQLVDTRRGSRLLAASDGKTAVVNLDEAPPEFAADCIVGVVQMSQPGVFFLHAASVGVAGSGVLLIAQSHGGKSTSALTLAWRGHAFLGDDVAAVRMATSEVIPFPKSAGLRDGPLARLLEHRLVSRRHVRFASGDGSLRTLVRVGELFPGSRSGSLPLRFAFLLDGFADRVAVTPYAPRLADTKRLLGVVADTTAVWGISPGRDLMNYLKVVNLLSRLRCYLVQLGSPDETARVIEDTVEESCT